MTFDPTPFQFFESITHWLLALGSFVLIVFIVALLASLAVKGAAGPVAVFSQIRRFFVEVANLSCRRIWALTILTFKEAVRRKALMVFVVFAILFMFAGWFLSGGNARPELQAKVYISFVLTAVTWLVLPVVLLLACWGLPEDIRTRTLHTVVTKPARRSEIVIGRVAGFTGVGTLLLVIMAIVGYVWILRYVPPEAELTCRVPVYGTMSFRDREGRSKDEQGNPVAGLNVGDIWEFRQYIEGATKAAAIWQFEVGAPRESLTLESRFEAFRSHKGTIGQGIFCRFVLVNESNKLRVELPALEVAEFTQNITTLNRKINYSDGDTQKTVDLFNDLVHDDPERGKLLTVEVQCLDAAQYVGMAQSDLFIRLPDNPFETGFTKAILGIWLMMALIVVLGVTASSFVKGPVAALLTFTLIVVGQGFREFMVKLVSGEQQGGGSIESWYRLVTHLNQTSPMPDTTLTTVIQSVDGVLLNALWLVQHIVPNFGHYQMAPYVANGFDVPWSAAMLPSLAVTLAYLVPCLFIGYYSLSLRELEAK